MQELAKNFEIDRLSFWLSDGILRFFLRAAFKCSLGKSISSFTSVKDLNLPIILMYKVKKLMKIVMFYEVALDGLSKAPLYYEAHRARLNEFHERGELLMAGPFANPAEGALGVFTSREAAEKFIEGDPFVIHGVVSKWNLREWNEVLV